MKEQKEESHLSKYDQIWLWHRRLRNLKFDHIIKLRNNEAVKVLPNISKPYDSVCKSCQMGKLTRTQFKYKNFTSTYKSISAYGFVWTIKEGKNRTRKIFYVGH